MSPKTVGLTKIDRHNGLEEIYLRQSKLAQFN